MRRQRGKRLTAILVAASSACAVAGFGAMMTDLGPWYVALRKPSWQPPDWAFAPAWTLIFTLTAWAGVLGWQHAGDEAARATVIAVFAANGVLNMLWSILFFKLRRPDWALYEVGFLWLSIVAMIEVLRHEAGMAWIFLVPYLLWVSFAAFLTATIVRLNAPFTVTA